MVEENSVREQQNGRKYGRPNSKLEVSLWSCDGCWLQKEPFS